MAAHAPRHAQLSAHLSPCGLQVFELQPGVLSGVIWHEISLLRACSHPQIVPVYGVALQVGGSAGSGAVCKPRDSRADRRVLRSLPAAGGCRAAQCCGMWRDGTTPCACVLRPSFLARAQGQLLMVAMQLMLGGSLRAAVLDPDRHEELSWGAR